jgi:glycosidase
MNLSAVHHRCAFTDCYAAGQEEVVIRLHTGKDVTSVSIIHDDPFAHGCMGHKPWYGTPEPMECTWELKNSLIWTFTARPPYKREQYYFSVTAGEETLLMFEDGFYTPQEAEKPGRLKQYFKFPWLNASDVAAVPQWVSDTVWYQIMPDRFCRGNMSPKRFPLRKWNADTHPTPIDFFGGDLQGITQRIPYLKELGITGIYMTPIFLSNSNHKYNTFSYETIDPDFGTEEDLIRLVETAHSHGIRVMLDAVFNHCGTELPQWQDAVKRGPESPYFHWFFINKWPLPVLSKLNWSTADGRYYSFAFGASMPKLNTGNPEVASYFLDRCRYWIEKWNIDGIRFDVGNEVSHSFLKLLNRELLKIKPDFFLLGELWHDAAQWLQGDEYHSVMNYPLMQSLNNFWLDELSSRELMYAINRVYSMYPRQYNDVLFNFLDTHDTTRALTRCASRDTFYQQLAILMTLPGSACVYYGTEVAMEGGDDPDCRRVMPWEKIDSGMYDGPIEELKALISLRKDHIQLRRGSIRWEHSEEFPRLVRYHRTIPGNSKVISLCINADKESVSVNPGKILYSRKLEGDLLLPGGILITESEV